jgi:hypothetical protein
VKIYEGKTVNKEEFPVLFLAGKNAPPCVQFGENYQTLHLDEARKVARAILALPRPIDAAPEAMSLPPGVQRGISFAEDVKGQPGRSLVTLECGHKLFTAEKLVSYACRECGK